MYFEGEQREFVHRRQTEGTWDFPSNSGTSWHGHFNKFKRKVKDDPDIMEIIWKKIDMTLNTKNPEDKNDGGCATHYEDDHRITEHIEAKIFIGLKQTEAQDIPVLNQTYGYYKPEKVIVALFNYNSNEKIYNSSDNKCFTGWSGHKTNVNTRRNAEKFEIANKQYVTQWPWLIAIDNETGKAVKIVPAGYEITYDIREEEKLHSERYSSNGTHKEDNTNEKKYTKTFEMGHVGKEIDDPTIKRSNTWLKDYMKRQGMEIPAGIQIPEVSNEETIKKISPDILVSSGAGKNNLVGIGHRTIRKQLDHGYKEEKMEYTWHMTLRKKPQH